jgi:hypothetical protein
MIKVYEKVFDCNFQNCIVSSRKPFEPELYIACCSNTYKQNISQLYAQ